MHFGTAEDVQYIVVMETSGGSVRNLSFGGCYSRGFWGSVPGGMHAQSRGRKPKTGSLPEAKVVNLQTLFTYFNCRNDHNILENFVQFTP